MECCKEVSSINNLFHIIQDRSLNDVKGVISDMISADVISSGHMESILYSLDQSGKCKRAILLYLLSMCLGKGEISSELRYIAASLEIMHSASLIHDDIIDDGLIRRGKDSVIKKFGLGKALLTGDYLIFTSIKAASKAHYKNNNGLEIISRMNSTYCDLCYGQSLEEILIGNVECTIEQYYEVIRLKTAVFFEMICEIAGLYENASKPVLKAVKGFGRNLGMAYQIRDDVLGFLEDKGHQDKSNTSDLERKLITLPIIIAYNLSTVKDKKIIKEYFKSGDNCDYGFLIPLIKKTGAIEITLKYVDDYVEGAKCFLKVIPESDAKVLLAVYADLLKV